MELKEFFQQCPKVALGFSGGVDSAYLLYAAVEHGAQVRPYFIKTQFQPQFELEDAKRLAAQLGVELTVLELMCCKFPMWPKTALIGVIIVSGRCLDGCGTRLWPMDTRY